MCLSKIKYRVDTVYCCVNIDWSSIFVVAVMNVLPCDDSCCNKAIFSQSDNMDVRIRIMYIGDIREFVIWNR